MIKKLPFLIIFFLTSLSAQHWEQDASVSLQAIISNKKDAPFWLHTNQRGRIGEATTVAGWANYKAGYQFNSGARIEVGAGGLVHDGFKEKFELDELYFSFEKAWFTGVVGRKQREDLYDGLSATNENMLWSLNARPMPGVRLFTNKPIMFWEAAGLGFEAGIEEYLMNDDRKIENARVHHKMFKLVYSNSRDLQIRLGAHHFVQWVISSPVYGTLPGGLRNYLRIATGGILSGSSNAMDYHQGVYEFNLKAPIRHYNIELFWNYIFEDGPSGNLSNFPDGRYGIYITDSRSNFWVDRFIYEFYYTRNQGLNNLDYFNDELYLSGWTYDNRVLGLPFMTLDTDFGIGNNTFVVHHLGLSGRAWEDFPFKAMASFRKNYGAEGSDYEPNDILSAFLEVEVLQAYIDLKVQLATDFVSDAGPNFGLGLNLSKELF